MEQVEQHGIRASGSPSFFDVHEQIVRVYLKLCYWPEETLVVLTKKKSPKTNASCMFAVSNFQSKALGYYFSLFAFKRNCIIY